MYKLLGTRCPSCGTGLPIVRLFASLGAERAMTDPSIAIRCPSCEAKVRLVGTRLSQLMKIAAIIVPLTVLAAWLTSEALIGIDALTYENLSGYTKLNLFGYLIVVTVFEITLLLSFFRILRLELVED